MSLLQALVALLLSCTFSLVPLLEIETIKTVPSIAGMKLHICHGRLLSNVFVSSCILYIPVAATPFDSLEEGGKEQGTRRSSRPVSVWKFILRCQNSENLKD